MDLNNLASVQPRTSSDKFAESLTNVFRVDSEKNLANLALRVRPEVAAADPLDGEQQQPSDGERSRAAGCAWGKKKRGEKRTLLAQNNP